VAGVEDYAIFLLDERGRIASWNAGAERIKGYSAAEVLGRHFSLLYPAEAVAAGWPEQELRMASEEGRFEEEGWRLRKDGTRFWASVTITPLRSERGVWGFLKITRDLTERKRAEEHLRRSEERFRLLVERVQDYAIFLLDPQGRIVTWNRGAERIKGYRASEILGQHFSRFYPPDPVAQAKPARELQAAAEYGSVEDEGWRVRKNGERFWANVVITALRDEDGKLIGFAKVTRDLTERRKVEALQEADRLKDEFLAILAHELRNPLAPIRNALHVVGQAAADPADIERARRMGERQVEHMARLLDDLLDVARIRQGSLELRKETVDLAQAVERAVDTVRPIVRKRRQKLTVDISPGKLWVEADPGRLGQVLTNLLDNASKYTGEEGRIWVSGEAEGGLAAIRIRDSGVGIDPLQLPHIFDLFVQADRRMDRSVGGVGVGLTLAKRLTELHGGTVEVFSAGRDRGSEFVVRLPRIEGTAPRREVEEETRSQPPLRAPLRILVVDDNVDAADSIALLLSLSGEQVRVAYDGPTAVTTARDFRPQVAFLDIGLPGMDGYELARRLREAPRAERMLLVALTGWGQPKDRLESTEAGFDHHLVKPADPARLEKLLEDVRAARSS
jgi:PAS domain S-box-containing protein